MAGCAEKQNLCTGRLRGLVNISQYNSHICYALIKLEENEARERMRGRLNVRDFDSEAAVAELMEEKRRRANQAGYELYASGARE